MIHRVVRYDDNKLGEHGGRDSREHLQDDGMPVISGKAISSPSNDL